MEDEWINTIKVIALGGEKVFLKVDEEEDFNVLMKESNQLFNRWFNVGRAWETRDVSVTRFTWCRIYRVFVHAWRRNIFSTLSTSFGRLIKIDAATENMQKLDVSRVLVRTSILEFINKTKRVQINGESSTIRIREEICECAPYREELRDSKNSEEVENYDTYNIDDTFIPPSVTSM